MSYIIKNTFVYKSGSFFLNNIFVNNGVIVDISNSDSSCFGSSADNFNNCFVFPGFTDVHVHFREPGFSYKETIKQGSRAAAHGGFTTVCTMPNLSPVPDSNEHLQTELDIIRRDACINVIPYGSITVNEEGKVLSDMEGIYKNIVAFSDDGHGIQDAHLMQRAMENVKALGKILVAHCEVNSLLNGGYIHDGRYAKAHDHGGICSRSEWEQIERDINLSAKTGCPYHICHISTKESVELIRQAKASGVDVTCETAPHYLTLCEDDLIEDGRFKMNPPLRSYKDKEALLEGLCDGTIDMIATDHAPHSKEEKSRGLSKSAFGVTGLEAAFPILYTKLVRNNVITLEKLIDLLHTNPNKRFKIGTSLCVGQKADLTVFDLNSEYIINTDDFYSLGKSTPFEGMSVFGKCKMTIVNGGLYKYD